MIFRTLLFSALMISPAFGITGKVIKSLGEDNLLNVVIKEGDRLKTKEGEVLIEFHPSLQVILLPSSIIKLQKDEIFLEKGSLRYLARDPKTPTTVSSKMIKFSPQGSEVQFEVSKLKNEVVLNVEVGEVEATSPLVMTFMPEIIKANKGFAFSEGERKFEQRNFKLQNKTKLEFKRKQD